MVQVRVLIDAVVEVDVYELIDNSITEALNDLTLEELAIDGELVIEEA